MKVNRDGSAHDCTKNFQYNLLVSHFKIVQSAHRPDFSRIHSRCQENKLPLGHLVVSGMLLYAAAVLQDAHTEIVLEQENMRSFLAVDSA